jgi:hypothetical protein
MKATWIPLLALAACQTTATAPAPSTPSVVDPEVPTDVSTPGNPASAFRLAGERGDARLVLADGADHLILDTDLDALLVMRADRDPVEVPLAGEPTRMVRVGDTLFVTLRRSGEIVRLQRSDTGWTETARAAIGAEPYGLAVSRFSDVVWVALSMEDAIVALDPETFEELDRVPIAGEPRWVRTAPLSWGTDTVVVATAHGGLARLEDGEFTVRPLPERARFTHDACPDRVLASRITGDIVLRDNGDVLVPSLYADTTLHEEDFGTPIEDLPSDADCRPPQGEQERPAYGQPAERHEPNKTGRLNPILVRYAADGSVEPIHVAATSHEFRCDGVHRSYPTQVELFDDGLGVQALLPMESSGAMIFVNLEADSRQVGDFAVKPAVAHCAPTGIRGVHAGDDIVGWSPFTRELVGWQDADRAMPNTMDWQHIRTAPFTGLDPDLMRGRMLFFSANQPMMAAADAGVSCSSCHDEGRADGFTWAFAPGDLRQTMSLAGNVSATAPITWNGDVASVAHEVAETSTERMGGAGLTAIDIERVARFVDSTRDPIPPAPADTGLVAEGRELFYSADVACATCHVGPEGTDNANHQVLGFAEATNTPKLRGIRASAPYFHDGSAATLRDVLEAARDGSMGDTSSLDDHQLDALEAFLATW